MSFIKRTWLARIGTGLNKFIIGAVDGDGKQTLVNSPDSVSQQGDVISAENLNDLEDRIAEGFGDTISIRANAGFHNSVYRGKDITEYWTNGTLHSRIQGTNGFELFEDLFVGDFFATGSASIGGSTQAQYWIIAGFDFKFKDGTAEHHIVLLPCNSSGTELRSLYTQYMYNYMGYTGAYADSRIAQDSLSGGTLYTGLYNIFSNNLLSNHETLTNINDSDGATSTSGVTTYAILLSESEIVGQPIFSINRFDLSSSNRGRVPIFTLKPDLSAGETIWLRNCFGNGFGIYQSRVSTAGAWITATLYNSFGVCPRFLIK